MSHNFYIGQDIVCIKNHSQGLVKEGDCYVVKGLRKLCCGIEIDAGLTTDAVISRCPDCGNTEFITGRVAWIGSALFAPLDTLTDISEIEEVLSKPAFEI